MSKTQSVNIFYDYTIVSEWDLEDLSHIKFIIYRHSFDAMPREALYQVKDSSLATKDISKAMPFVFVTINQFGCSEVQTLGTMHFCGAFDGIMKFGEMLRECFNIAHNERICIDCEKEKRKHVALTVRS